MRVPVVAADAPDIVRVVPTLSISIVPVEPLLIVKFRLVLGVALFPRFTGTRPPVTTVLKCIDIP